MHAAINEQGSESSEQESEEEVKSGTFGPQHEAVFFGIIGAMYVPIGLWILKKKDQTKTLSDMFSEYGLKDQKDAENLVEQYRTKK